jgi:branched-chain amino acid aminotransferase
MSLDAHAWWYCDGVWCHPQEATISINDVAVLRGYSLFESLPVYKRKPFHLADNIRRLYHSSQVIDLEVPYTAEEITALITEVIERNPYENATLRILVTGGITEDAVLPSGKPSLYILITPAIEMTPERWQQGIKVISVPFQREAPEAKSTSYLVAIKALKQAARQGAQDALYYNSNQEILECTRSNIFLVREGILLTPREGILTGLTRNLVLELARNRFPIEERVIPLEEVWHADEAFTSSSGRGIMPVVQVDGQQIGDGRGGPITRKLYELVREAIANR